MALLFIGSAILFFSCNNDTASDPANDEGLMTEYSEGLTIVESENGKQSYVFTAPLMEGYTLAREPYREFREGIDITTYQKDSTDVVDTHMSSGYAINYTGRRLWEAKGNVVVRKANGEELHTQQLFWNEQTGRIWSNVDSRIVQQGGLNLIVEGFESDQQLKNWTFRRAKGRMLVDVEPTRQPADSTAVN